MTVYLVHPDGTVETLTTRRTPAEVTADRHAAEVCARLVAERNTLAREGMKILGRLGL